MIILNEVSIDKSKSLGFSNEKSILLYTKIKNIIDKRNVIGDLSLYIGQESTRKAPKSLINNSVNTSQHSCLHLFSIESMPVAIEFTYYEGGE